MSMPPSPLGGSTCEGSAATIAIVRGVVEHDACALADDPEASESTEERTIEGTELSGINKNQSMSSEAMGGPGKLMNLSMIRISHSKATELALAL